jgi:2-iminobutanoate/2-iminopropanoate deaminase
MRKAVSTPKAPRAIGPYSQGVSAGGWVFVSGQIPAGPDGALIGGDVAAQTERCLANVAAILESEGLTLADVVKTTVFLTDMKQFPAMNEAYARGFKEPFPARATVEVSALPKGAAVEIEAVAAKRG